jgi:hypothetical protein
MFISIQKQLSFKYKQLFPTRAFAQRAREILAFTGLSSDLQNENAVQLLWYNHNLAGREIIGQWTATPSPLFQEPCPCPCEGLLYIGRFFKVEDLVKAIQLKEQEYCFNRTGEAYLPRRLWKSLQYVYL